MRLKTGHKIILIGFLLFSCEKNKDPFFNSFPKTFYYSRIEKISEIRLFTNRSEIFDSVINSNFMYSSTYFDQNRIDSQYLNDYMVFKNSNTISYYGHLNWLYDTLYYIKEGSKIFIKTDTISSTFWDFSCESILCKMDSWKMDSIGWIDLPAGGFTEGILLYAINKVYKMEEPEMRIPIISYKYPSRYLGCSGYHENEFNNNVISDLSCDTLAIINYEVIFEQK